VKSVLGEFSSGVFVFRNKRTQSDLEAPFWPGPLPAVGYRGAFLRLCIYSTFSCIAWWL